MSVKVKKYKNILIVVGVILLVPVIGYLGLFLYHFGQYLGTFYRNIYEIVCFLAQNM